MSNLTEFKCTYKTGMLLQNVESAKRENLLRINLQLPTDKHKPRALNSRLRSNQVFYTLFRCIVFVNQTTSICCITLHPSTIPKNPAMEQIDILC